MFPRFPELGPSSMCGGREGNLGLEQAGGLQAAALLGQLLGAGDPARATGNLVEPCQSKGCKEGRVPERWVFCGRRREEIL